MTLIGKLEEEKRKVGQNYGFVSQGRLGQNLKGTKKRNTCRINREKGNERERKKINRKPLSSASSKNLTPETKA